MGNCLRNNNKVSSQDHDENYGTPIVGSKVEKVKVFPLSKMEAPRVVEQSMNKKVRFKMQNDDNCEGERGSDSKSRRVRIRVVMTQEELKRMLKCKDDDEAQHHTTLEQLLDAVKLRGGRISEVGVCNQRLMNSWRPTLDCIPEDRLINLG